MWFVPLTSPSQYPFFSSISVGHFRVPKSFAFKTRLSAKPLLWKWVLIMMQIKLISTTKVSHLASFWKWNFLELGNGLLTFRFILSEVWQEFRFTPDFFRYLKTWSVCQIPTNVSMYIFPSLHLTRTKLLAASILSRWLDHGSLVRSSQILLKEVLFFLLTLFLTCNCSSWLLAINYYRIARSHPVNYCQFCRKYT